MELVVEVVILLSLLVVKQYNKQRSCFFVATILSVPESARVPLWVPGVCVGGIAEVCTLGEGETCRGGSEAMEEDRE